MDEARKIFQWGFRSFETKFVLAAGETVGAARLYGGASLSVPLVTAGDVRILVPRGNAEHITAKIVYDGPIPAPVEEGRELARLRIFRGQTEAVDLPLKAGESVPQGPLYRRAFDASLELAQQLIQKYIFKR